jgi:diaminohydroxyphosphoribosylaminopyrimidine deaminase / 5-amino-6-(5-phosphoribosylamino)uracil reductase
MTRRHDIDVRHMRRALRLAERGRGRTSPNPVVGAVLVKGGRVVGEGWHHALGADHAEVVALERAGRLARGATLYVTLEPCAHTGRTPPCVDALIAAGVRRCVAAIRDPYRLVNGRGLRRLRAAGMRVEVGLCAPEARRALAAYLKAQTTRMPRVTWKVAASLDGRIADGRGRSKWVTGPAARRAGRALRAASDAIVIGARTALHDDPRLTVRDGSRGRQPLRVVCDTMLRLPGRLRLFGPRLARGTVVVCGPRATRVRQAALEARGVRVWRVAASRTGVSPAAVARRLMRDGRYEVLLEGGAALGTAWWRAGLVDQLALFAAPRAIGGEGLAWCGPLPERRLGVAQHGRITELTRVGDDAFMRVEW